MQVIHAGTPVALAVLTEHGADELEAVVVTADPRTPVVRVLATGELWHVGADLIRPVGDALFA